MSTTALVDGFFNEVLPKFFTANPEVTRKLGLIYVFNLTDGESYTVDLKRNPYRIHKGEIPPVSDCRVDISSKDLQHLLDTKDKVSGMKLAVQLLSSGRLKVTSVPHLMALMQYLK